ncbi:MAG: TVP38/TMEM64 family protein [Deltaproteobacteria bacterium]|nr:MAG: TVP38/TMEM64 family protein [Deltaproteobacteria bacterium]
MLRKALMPFSRLDESSLPMRLFSWSKSRWIWIAGLFILSIVFVVYQYHPQLWAQAIKFYNACGSRRELKRFILSFGAYSPLAYMIIQVLQVVVAPIPGGAIEFLGGYIFGTRAGFAWSMIGLFFGSWMAFALARVFEKWAVEKFVSPQTRKKFDYLIGHEGVILSFLLFLIPGFPKDALCYILGLTPMHTGIFLIISTLGRIPGTLMANLQGAKAFDAQYKTFLILLGMSTLIILVFYIYHNEIHEMIKKLHRTRQKG